MEPPGATRKRSNAYNLWRARPTGFGPRGGGQIWETVCNEIGNHILTDEEMSGDKTSPWVPDSFHHVSSKGSCVGSFLKDHGFLYPLLNEARSQIYKYFGDVMVSLEVYRYHEEPYEEELVVYIHSPFSVSEAMGRLDSLLQEWWLDNLDEAKGKMGFDLRFQ